MIMEQYTHNKIHITIYHKNDPVPPRERLIRTAAVLFPEYGDLTEEEWGWASGERGKPFFRNCPEVSFSITHSGDYWISGVSSQPLGIDLQQHQQGKKCRGISNRFFHPDEDEYLRGHEDIPFYDIWAAKESYVKFTGQGIDDSFGKFSVVRNGAIASEINGVLLKKIMFREGYSLYLCHSIEEIIEIHSMDNG